MNLSRKSASILRVASVFALGAALVPLLAGPAHASGTINQQAPFFNSGTVTPATSAGFPDQLLTDSAGTVTFTTTLGTDFDVSSSGAVSVPSPLPVGSYTVSGIDSDTLSNTGTWTYTLNVTAATIVQTAPTSNGATVTPASSSAFTDHLVTTGGEGTISYTQSGPSIPAGVLVLSTGEVTTSGPLDVGSYTASGTTSDTYGDTAGTWTYTLNVTADTLGTTPTTNAATVTPATSSVFTDLLVTTGGEGTISYTQSGPSSPAGVLVLSTGEVTTSGPLDVGSYTASGTTSDTYGDTAGTWTYTLNVTAGTLVTTPTLNVATVTPATSAGFTDTLGTTGGEGAITYTQTVGETSVVVSPTGAVSAAADLSVGSHVASGTNSDPAGDTGTWSYTLTVTNGGLTQDAPLTNAAAVTPASSSTLTDQLAASGAVGGSVTFIQSGTSSPAGVLVSSTGAVSTSGPLHTGTYTATGTDYDPVGDTGIWSYTLNVTAATIGQTPPTSNASTVTPATSAGFTSQLAAGGGVGAVSFATTGSGSTPPGVNVSVTGVVSTTGTIAVGSYVISGTDSDIDGDNGTWTYTLTVSATAITQSAPTTNATTPANSMQFTDQLSASGGAGAITFTQSTGAPDLKVSSSGKVTVGSALAKGSYTATGTDADGYRDNGTWTYTLTVSATAITQSAPKSNATVVTPADSSGFTAHLAVTGNKGAVKYALTGSHSTPPGLVVSSAGVVSTKGALPVGTYTAIGTDSDPLGDSGPWSYSLTVTATKISQSAPTGGTTTTATVFAGKLKVTGYYGTVTYSQASGKPSLTVSSSGAVSSLASLAAGVYKATGTVKDSYGDTAGTWGFSLTVTATRISQASPMTANVGTNKAFSGQLKVTGSHGTVTYAQTRGAPDLRVSTSGAVSSPANLARGLYTASGTDFDSLHDTGKWSYTLIVGATTIRQAGSETATTAVGKAFRGQVKVSGAHGTVTYVQTQGAPHLKVSSSGKVSAPANLAKGTYKANGTESDSFGDKGSWSFTLTVEGGRLAQVTPVKASTVTGRSFTAVLKFFGGHGKLTYTQSSGAPYLRVSSSGAISATGTLAAGTYKATGGAKDSLGDSGSWSFSLKVTATRLLQTAPFMSKIAAGKAFAAQLKVAGSHGKLTYAQSSGAPRLNVSSSGAVSAPATLTAGSYKASGSARDALGDSGSWTYTLTVTGHKLTQLAPLKATVPAGTTFKDRLKITAGRGKLTYAQSKGAPELKVSTSGVISAPASLKPGIYKASGTVSDSSSDSGSWLFTLTVKANQLEQISPTKATTGAGTAFDAQLKVKGAHGKTTFVETKGAPHLKVSSSGRISAPATLKKGTYAATGTVKDSSGRTGIWSFTLTVKVSTLKQAAPTAGRTVSGTAFTAQLEVSGASGKVTFTQLTGAQVMTVSSTGKVSAPATLAAASYTITGTAKDSAGGTCKWTFTLFVAA